MFSQEYILGLEIGLGAFLLCFFCEDYCPDSLYLCSEFSAVLLRTATLNPTLNVLGQVKQTVSHLVSMKPPEANKLAQHFKLILTPVLNLF